MTKAEIRAILINPAGVTGRHQNRYLVYRMLQAMFDRQTADEQASDDTKHVNGVGFNGVDAPLLSDVAKRSKQYNNLTIKQAAMVARRLTKYTGQLEAIAAAKQIAKAAEQVPAVPVEPVVPKGTLLVVGGETLAGVSLQHELWRELGYGTD